MPFQTPITVKKVLERIQAHEYVLPAIQREFVWSPDQICLLFDSLLRGYPIGSFLFWKVDPENVREYRFYYFVRNYHQRDHPHCPELDVPPERAVVAILDGQQRLTALTIGLRGSHAEKMPRKWWSSPDAFPKRRLYLNLVGEAPENEQGMQYAFRFLTEDQAAESDGGKVWFPVWRTLEFEDATELHGWLVDAGVGDDKRAFKLLNGLHSVITKDLVINFFEEESQDLAKVLDIFIRTNSGGTVLSYSDLLLSIATAQWTSLDARKEIHELVDTLNDVRHGFELSKDFVLKGGLMLADVASVGFRVTNFNRGNMALLEERWSAIRKAMHLTVLLAAEYGFSARNLSADNALLPMAYYLYRRRLDERWLQGPGCREDRERIRGWLVRSLVKRGVWGSGLDTLLTAIRSALRESTTDGFPVEAIEETMARRGKSLRFADEELEDLVDIDFNDRRTFPVLSLLFPFIDLRHDFHVDHIFPRNEFTPRRLKEAGAPAEDAEQYRDWMNRLGNLQLLQGTENVAKQAAMPDRWLRESFTDEAARSEYRERHLLGSLPGELSGFGEFYQRRRERLLGRLRELLGA